VTEIQKPADQAEQKAIQKTPEAAAVSGVVAAQPNQDAFGEAKAVAHANDKTLSEPDMIAMGDNETPAQYNARVAQIQANRFGFYDSGADASTKVFEKPAKQAVEPMPALAPVLSEGPYNSTVKLNVQITNVPEVSEGVKPEELLQYTDTMLQSGVQVVRQFEQHMTEANAINNDISSLAAHFSQSPYQLNEDIQALIASIDQPMNADERAEAAGNLLPLFFFEGAKEPINPETVEQMSLEGMTEEELSELGIEKRVSQVSEENAANTELSNNVESGEIRNQESLEVDIQPKPGSLSIIEARDWYNAEVAKIDQIEQGMRQAGKTPQEIFEVTTEIRNQAKRLARDYMKDRRAAARLDKESPILPKEEYLAKYDGDYEKAIEASKRTNADVNQRIEELRKEREQDS